jgi:hypothetical protein
MFTVESPQQMRASLGATALEGAASPRSNEVRDSDDTFEVVIELVGAGASAGATTRCEHLC